VNKLSMTDDKRILGLLLAGWSDRQIARDTGKHRATIARRLLRRSSTASCTTAT
jgi:IS30 family transposase